MCHCLSKMGIGSADEMTSTWRCRLYHMAVSLAIKKNWQARIAVVWAEGAGFLRESLILRVLTHFVVLVPGNLAPSEAGVVAWTSCRMELLRTRSAPLQILLVRCRACCHAGTNGWMDTRMDRRTLAVRVLRFQPEGLTGLAFGPRAKIFRAPSSSELWAEVAFAFLKRWFWLALGWGGEVVFYFILWNGGLKWLTVLLKVPCRVDCIP